MRYILLDRILSLTPPTEAVGVKCVSLSDDVFADHFPGHPVMPGALLLEGMAQLGGVLLEAGMRAKGRADLHALLTMADKVRFRRPVVPGDRVIYTVRGERVSVNGGRLAAEAHCEGVLVAQAELAFAFVEVTHPELLARRREYLEIWLHGGLSDAL